MQRRANNYFAATTTLCTGTRLSRTQWRDRLTRVTSSSSSPRVPRIRHLFARIRRFRIHLAVALGKRGRRSCRPASSSLLPGVFHGAWNHAFWPMSLWERPLLCGPPARSSARSLARWPACCLPPAAACVRSFVLPAFALAGPTRRVERAAVEMAKMSSLREKELAAAARTHAGSNEDHRQVNYMPNGEGKKTKTGARWSCNTTTRR